MPTKYGRTTWNRVRHEVNELIAQGIDPREAARQVSERHNGRPAAGTILNYFANGWKAPGVKKETSSDVQALHDQIAELRRHVAHLVETLDEATSDLGEANKEIARLAEDNAALREAKAHAEGRAEVATEVIRDVADIDVQRDIPTNAHGHPAI